MRALGVTVVLVAILGLGSAQGQATGGQPDPCQAKTRVVADESYCDRYWECVNGQPQLFDCPNGLVYIGKNRGIAEGCDYPWRSANYCVNKQAANPPIATEHCEWLYGIFGHETSCTRYWTCWNGTATEQFCIGGLLYNEETHACDWPQNVAGCQKHPLCKEDANANVPLGKSCERYWACQGGYPRLQRCPATLVFDRVSRRCIAPPTADCDVPSTTPRPAQLARQGGGQRQGQGQGQGQRKQQQGGQGQGQGQGQRKQQQGGQFRDQVQSPQNQQQQRPRPQARRPTTLRAQEQELPPQEQFVDELPVGQENFHEPAPQFQESEVEPPRSSFRPVRPPRPNFSNQGPPPPFKLPAGAVQIPFNSGGGQGPRLSPIPGAIPIRFN